MYMKIEVSIPGVFSGYFYLYIASMLVFTITDRLNEPKYFHKESKS